MDIEFTTASLNEWNHAFDEITYFERYLTPSLSSRGIDIKEYSSKLLNNGVIIYVFVDGQMAGIAGVYANDMKRRDAFLSIIVVDPVYQSQGIGGRLLEEAERIARKHDMKHMRLEVHTDNVNGVRFYERHGYAEVGPCSDNSCYMEKKISRSCE